MITMALALIFCVQASAQKNDTPLRLGVAGVSHGHLGEVGWRVGRGDFEVVGVYESNKDYWGRNALSKKVSQDKFYDDLGKMLDETKPEVVVAYGSIYDHLSVVEACAPRHIHVMVEKPLATTVKQALKIKALAEKYGIMVLTNFETSWYATNQYAKQLVDSGEVGDVIRIDVYDGHEGPAEIGCDDKFLGWLTDPVLNGGGAVMDFGCYGANLATWLMGGKAPKSVYAVLKQHKTGVYPKVDDDATILVEYDNCTLQIMPSWYWPYSRKDMYIYGSKGYIYQKNGKEMQIMKDAKLGDFFEAPALKTPYEDSFYYLKAAVRGEITVTPQDLASVENNVMVVRILEAAKKSAKTGKAVRF